eukprot:Plantae.Rhodophyta-Rhodochaete_pulchella.ctg1676.p2 GENE.Plantae.Rhodophyta-Rhodochaete_pulchella.ctg1676~~Plantae.Rhodophyta-Rhodochaete_pulchella.ctg1676.p2  ORF type:complete len:200 (-),score=37.15 Plantae.Rhodophyta-Rhodochaete_pulchella.ctg1676:679-1278(-)
MAGFVDEATRVRDLMRQARRTRRKEAEEIPSSSEVAPTQELLEEPRPSVRTFPSRVPTANGTSPVSPKDSTGRGEPKATAKSTKVGDIADKDDLDAELAEFANEVEKLQQDVAVVETEEVQTQEVQDDLEKHEQKEREAKAAKLRKEFQLRGKRRARDALGDERPPAHASEVTTQTNDDGDDEEAAIEMITTSWRDKSL